MAVKKQAAGTAPAGLLHHYRTVVVPKLMESFGYGNLLAVPRVEKICINMGVGRALENPRMLETAVEELSLIAGQRAVPTTARKAISTWRLRQGYKIGCRVTLRGSKMYDFLERLVNVAIPRIRDFRGMSPRAFDGHGNYTMGISEQTTFPEIDADKTEFAQGMDITIVTSAKTDAEAKALLEGFGFPFRAS